MVILMCEETGGMAGRTSNKEEHCGKPDKGKEVENHYQTSYS